MSRLILSTLLLTTFASPAFAYLDPGTGSIIVQSIVGGIAMGGAFLGMYWDRFKVWIDQTFKQSGDQGNK